MFNAVFQLLVIMIFPAGISLAATYLGRATISRTGLYLVSTTVVLYLVYIAVFYVIAETLRGGFAISKPNPAAAVQVRSLTPNLFVCVLPVSVHD